MLRAVVDAGEHHVFESDEVARGMRQVPDAGGEQFAQWILAVDRHQPVAQRIARRVQRYGKRNRTFLAQPVYQGHDPGCGHGHAPARQAICVVIEHQP